MSQPQTDLDTPPLPPRSDDDRCGRRLGTARQDRTRLSTGGCAARSVPQRGGLLAAPAPDGPAHLAPRAHPGVRHHTTVMNAAGRHVAGLKNGERCNAHSDMRQLALEIIAKTPFDIDLGEHAAPFEQAMNALFERNVALHAAVRGPGPRRRRPPSPFRTSPPASTCSPPCWLHRTTSSAA